jgi:hypothetical protein
MVARWELQQAEQGKVGTSHGLGLKLRWAFAGELCVERGFVHHCSQSCSCWLCWLHIHAVDKGWQGQPARQRHSRRQGS